MKQIGCADFILNVVISSAFMLWLSTADAPGWATIGLGVLMYLVLCVWDMAKQR